MNAIDLISASLARPMTHRVATVYEGGTVKTHDTPSAAQAENWATGERRKIGKILTDHETGATVRVIAVTVDRI